jgi:hypothetical protein
MMIAPSRQVRQGKFVGALARDSTHPAANMDIGAALKRGDRPGPIVSESGSNGYTAA